MWNALTMLKLTPTFVLLLFTNVQCVIRNCDELVVKHGMEIKTWHPVDGGKNVSTQYKIVDEKFAVHVSNTGPAVIGSEIDFLAELSAETIVTEKKRFLYHWMNDADNSEKLESTNNYKSNISSYIFDSELILPNKYKMKVCVYKRHKEFYVKVAENHTLFELTASLNGKAKLHQNLTHPRTHPDIFCAMRTMQYSVNLTDKFSIAPTYWFEWYVDGEHMETKENINFFEFVHNKTGMCELKVIVTMDSFGMEQKLHGTWSRSIYLEEEVQVVDVLAASEVVSNDPINLNITFDGTDVEVCWRITDLNNHSQFNKSCDGPLSSGWYMTPKFFLSQGQYVTQVNVTNDVSAARARSHVFSVYNGGGSGTSSLLVVPVLFSLLGVVVIVGGAAFIVRIRRKSDVEVADFDFHPEIESQESQLLVRIRGTLSDLFQRNEYIRRHRLAKYHRTSAKTYGSLGENNDEL